MAESIKYNPETLRSKASEMRTYISSYAEAMDCISNLVNTLPDVWSGEAMGKFVDTFQELISGFSNVDELLEQYASALEKSADNMEGADKQHEKNIRAIG